MRVVVVVAFRFLVATVAATAIVAAATKFPSLYASSCVTQASKRIEGDRFSKLGRFMALMTRFMTIVALIFARAATLASVDDDDFRLSTDVRPLHYELALNVDVPRSDRAQALVCITLIVERSTSTIMLNALALAIDVDRVRLEETTSGEWMPLLALVDEMRERQQIQLHFESPLHVGRNYSLSIAYKATITNAETGGLYFSGRPA